ncbi:hypothetical protein EWF95_04735 [Halonotius roseus]|uniref:Glycosyltransferase RgtA/B/C/D-like domain-containing protein n=1 Tax=Halonotius roseus TaxID=2511997 RepID=A0A544QSV6_9EURY|nr:hypothetical protein EWF95_04735 [Halonotius roseus]
MLPRPTVIRAGFTGIGASVALALFVASEGDSETVADTSQLSPSLATKVVLVAAAGAVIAAAELNSRLVPLAVLVPLGLFAVAFQLRTEPSVPAVLTQLTAVFGAAQLAKYVTTGFYFGGSDSFAHVAAVDALIEARYTTAIPHGYDLYPVFHFVIGAVKHATGLPTYDALVLTGIGLLTLVVPIAYLLGWSVFGSQRLGLLAAFSVTLLEFFSYHALYFYPQALASVFLLIALYINSQLRQATDERAFRRLSVFVIALVAMMVFTHHLTYLLFAVVAAVAIPIALGRRYLFGQSAARRRLLRYRWLFPGVIGAVFLLAYWSYSPSLITVGIVELTAGVLFDVATMPTQQLFTYGVTLPVDSVDRAVAWLLTPTGLYASGLGALLLVAAYELLAEFRSYQQGFTLTVTGLSLSVLLLPLPIAIPQIERLKFVVTLVVLFPLAVGLKRVLSVDRRYAIVALVVIATLGGATTFTVLVADDLTETYIDEPRQQVSMSDSEFESVGAASTFLQRYGDGPAATDRVTNRAFETSGFNATRTLQARPSGLRTGGTYLVAREQWTDHLVALGRGLRTGELNSFTVSDARFRAAEATQTKVYTSGSVTVYRSEDGFRRLYGTNGTAL